MTTVKIDLEHFLDWYTDDPERSTEITITALRYGMDSIVSRVRTLDRLLAEVGGYLPDHLVINWLELPLTDRQLEKEYISTFTLLEEQRNWKVEWVVDEQDDHDTQDNQPTVHIDAGEFVEWFIDEKDLAFGYAHQAFMYGRPPIQEAYKTLRDLFDSTGYIPRYLILNWNELPMPEGVTSADEFREEVVTDEMMNWKISWVFDSESDTKRLVGVQFIDAEGNYLLEGDCENLPYVPSWVVFPPDEVGDILKLLAERETYDVRVLPIYEGDIERYEVGHFTEYF